MKKRNYFPALFMGIPFVGFCNINQQQAEKPNILVILADDLGTNELGCYGGVNVPTPNIDRLANEGVRFTNMYTSCAMSVPCRASLFTGLYPVRHGSFQNHKKTYSNIKSVVHYLADLGYRVGRTGKDHPVNQPVVYPFEKISGFTVSCTSTTANYTTDEINEFINRSNDPFCLYVCSINSHAPWTVGNPDAINMNNIVMPPNSVDNTNTRTLFRKYLAEIGQLDKEVGDVYKVLEASGKLNNTMVIFLGEQGPQMPFAKWTCYRYGQHSAFIARFPDKIQQATTNDALVQYEDILPAMIELAGGDPVEGLDSESCLDAIFGKKTEHREWAYGIHNNIPEGTAYPIRSIQDKRYKLIINLTPDAEYYEKHMLNPTNRNSVWPFWLESAKTNNHAKLLADRFVKRPAIEFYDLQEDPWELNNIAELSQYTDRIATMKTELEKWMTSQGDRGTTMDVQNPDSPIWTKSPTEVSTFNDLDEIRNDLTGFYYLTNDIVIPGGTEWTPIGATGTSATPDQFTGIIDGNGHVIKNVKISDGGNFTGFIGRLTNGGTVMNLGLENVDIKGKTPTGGLAGSIFEAAAIEKVYVTGSIRGENEVGGLVGRSNNQPENIISDCFVNARIEGAPNGTTAYAGGLIGIINGKTVTISNSYAAGNVQIAPASTRTYYAGGLIGAINNNVSGALIQATATAVLTDEITGGTPNLLVGGILQATTLTTDNVYACNDISLIYADAANKGKGDLLATTDMLRPRQTFLTKDFYETNLSWDLENVWEMKTGGYPVLNNSSTTSSNNPVAEKGKYSVFNDGKNIIVESAEALKIYIYDLSGKLIHSRKINFSHVKIPVDAGFYVVKFDNGRNKVTTKLLVI